MTDVEQELRRWLDGATPEPPRSITAELAFGDGVGEEPAAAPARRGWVPVLAAGCVLAVVGAVLAFVAALAPSRPVPPAQRASTAVASSSPVPQPHPPAPRGSVPPTAVPHQARPPADFAALRVIGAHGATAWQLTDTLRVSSDAGAHWFRVGLPSGVAAASIDHVDVGPDGTIWLTEARFRTVEVFHRDAATTIWRRSTLTPAIPAGLARDLGTVSVFVLTADPWGASIAAGWGLTSSGAITDVFVSHGYGESFRQFTRPDASYIRSITFISRDIALQVAGPISNIVYRSTDGGRSWRRLFGKTTQASASFGVPAVTARGIELPRIDAAGPSQDVTVLTSTDLGAHFGPPSGPALPVVTDTGDLTVAIRGGDVWVPAGDRIYESTDAGAHWAVVRSSTSVRDITLVASNHAIGQASADCTSTNPNDRCTLTDYLVGTDDGGRTWHAL